jgi:hypothetical protein
MAVAVALWLVAMLLHAVVASSLSLRLSASETDQRLQALDRTAGRCRIFLVGSSVVLMGLSATELEAATGCATVNAALLNISGQINEYLERILIHARPGDFVVLSDRSWTDMPLDIKKYTERPQWMSFLRSVSLAPHAMADLRVVSNSDMRRGTRGDNIEFTAVLGAPVLLYAAPLNDVPSRLQRISKQVQIIRASGARPILAATPVLVADSAKQDLESQFALLNQRVLATVGGDVWIGPMVETNHVYFAMEGQHSSEAGRRRWTQQIEAVILAKGKRPGP